MDTGPPALVCSARRGGDRARVRLRWGSIDRDQNRKGARHLLKKYFGYQAPGIQGPSAGHGTNRVAGGRLPRAGTKATLPDSTSCPSDRLQLEVERGVACVPAGWLASAAAWLPPPAWPPPRAWPRRWQLCAASRVTGEEGANFLREFESGLPRLLCSYFSRSVTPL